MKRSIIILLSAALLAITALGCGNTTPGGEQLHDPDDWDPHTTTTTTTAETTEDPYYEDDYPDENGYIFDEEDPTAAGTPAGTTQPGAAAATTRPGTTTTRATGATTTRAATPTPTTTTTRTTTRTTTAAPPNQQFANPITIANTQAAALERFNNTIAGVISRRAGFNKYHLVAGANLNIDTTLLDSIPALGVLGSPSEMISQALLDAMTGGAPTATQPQGQSSTVISASTLTAADLTGFDVRRNGTNWVITLYVRNSNSSFRRGGALTGGNPPIQRGPIARATDMAGGTVYDHMTADRAFNWIRDTFSALPGFIPGVQVVTPVAVTENTRNIRYIMTLDGGGNLISLQCIYDQDIVLQEATVMGQTVNNFQMAWRVTVNFRNFTR